MNVCNQILYRTCHQNLYFYSVSLTVYTLQTLTTQLVYCIIIIFSILL